MKAVRMHAFGNHEVLRVDEIETPTPTDGQVLIKVEAAGVTYGDIMKRQGAFGTDLPLPTGLGMEVAGTVAAAGADTGPRLRPGTRVAAWVEDGYAEYALAAADATIPLPDAIDFHSAAVLPVHGLTAYQTLVEAGSLRRGDTVLVHAAGGGVGSFAVQLAEVLGASMVIGTAGSSDKSALAQRLGADATVDYREPGWADQVRKLTEGRGVDLVLESTGGDIARQSLTCMAPHARMVCFGASSGTPAQLASTDLMHGNISITGYSLPTWLGRPDRIASALGHLFRLVAAGDLSVGVGETYPLHAAAEAHQAITERRALGRTVLVPSAVG